jgi:outer membrane protein assembly factor BamD
MKNKFSLALLALAIGMSGCSSLSMPFVPWFKSAAPADPTAEALFAEGSRYLSEKKYARAIDVLQKLKSGHPFSPLLTETELKVADAYYLNQQYPEAITAFKEFQSLHPTNENISFVILRLGQAHLNQFTSVDRDQKNTEIAKGYFETVITNHPKSPHAHEAAEKLAKCIQYLSEHDFNVAIFYHQQEKYPAARDRFEEIVRKYKGTPTAVKSLYYLGESYRKEKNWVKASLAYEALVQHYPETKFAVDARTQLAQLDKEKQDPLALLLMRDRRPGTAPAPETREEPALSKLKDLNLVAKKDLVYEEPGAEKGILRRVTNKLNPFSSADEPKQSATELLVNRKEVESKESSGILASLWPFGRQNSSSNSKPSQSTGLVGHIDDSLKQKGIVTAGQASLTPPVADLPKNDEAPPQQMDTGVLLGTIDSTLKKSGKTSELPPAPEAAAALREPPAIQTPATKTASQSETPVSSGLLSSIDQKLKSQGVEPSRFELPPSPAEVSESTAKNTPPVKVELEPKVNAEKGPLFLAPAELPSKPTSDQADDANTIDAKPDVAETNQPARKEAPRNLVRGPIQSQPANQTKTPEQKKAAPGEEETKGLFDYLRDDVENVSKILNPFRW